MSAVGWLLAASSAIAGFSPLNWELEIGGKKEKDHCYRGPTSVRALLRRIRLRLPLQDGGPWLGLHHPMGPWGRLDPGRLHMLTAPPDQDPFSLLGRLVLDYLRLADATLHARNATPSERGQVAMRRLIDLRVAPPGSRPAAPLDSRLPKPGRARDPRPSTRTGSSASPRRRRVTRPSPGLRSSKVPANLQRPHPPPVPVRLELPEFLVQETAFPLADLRGYFLRERAARWWVSNQSDDLLALPHCRIQRLDYQIRTALRVLGPMRGRALLSDEVGLGKTIEAGLVLKELLTRRHGETVPRAHGAVAGRSMGGGVERQVQPGRRDDEPRRSAVRPGEFLARIAPASWPACTR